MREDRYYFSKGKLFREYIELHQVGTENEVLSQLGDGSYSIIGEPYENIDYLAVNKHELHVVRYIKSIKLNTFYEPHSGSIDNLQGITSETVLIRPSWGGGHGTLKLSKTWIPPEYMKLAFITKLRADTRYKKKYRFHKCLLVSVINYTDNDTESTVTDIHRAPVSNIYSNGEICMGDNFSVSHDLGLSETVDYCYQSFDSSEWNRDLHESSVTKYILFDKNDKSIHPTCDTYRRQLPIISDSSLIHLVS